MTTLGTLVAGVALAGPASAHGYISSPPSRQALCAAGTVTDCGQIQYEPQSVEAPKGSRLCSGGNAAFSVLDDESRAWPSTDVGDEVTFNWTLTARHSTSTWVYYVDGEKVASFDDAGAIPNATVSHRVDLGDYSGEHTVLAVWNIADTVNAFYNCVDVNVGGAGDQGEDDESTTPTTPAGGSTGTPSGPATTYPADGTGSSGDTGGSGSSAPTTTADPTSSTSDPDGSTSDPDGSTSDPDGSTSDPGEAPESGDWQDWTWYDRGDTVTYDGVTYECRQSHTTLPGWEPPNVLALWLPE
ncbi:lytic polysaccharide monooxygenase [Kineosporia sp. J2-2]|uniref:Lytic polysaccharide monooxygenase n=1 Tax=Kineosporia corallincola TaxID=2835133 RepID=A0ABS5THQ9_9ACTN|nr:lytic polysaccharide monooxygenase [Kineosporia corallincola]MBT0770629.1 lytic polysaccharide monooxygenase [Kineosporia corallincola]